MDRNNKAGQKFCKIRGKNTELSAIKVYLFDQPATATQVAVALGIYRPSVCRRKRELQLAGQLWEVRKVICPITHAPASLLTCNPRLKRTAKGGAQK